MGLAASDPDASGWISAFEQVLQKSGWSEGRNIKIEYRWGTGDARIIRAYAAELIGLAPEVIVTRAGRHFAAAHVSAFGTKQTYRACLLLSAFGGWGKADIAPKCH
jgi:putative ABC transport system substrate-binding protein